MLNFINIFCIADIIINYIIDGAALNNIVEALMIYNTVKSYQKDGIMTYIIDNRVIKKKRSKLYTRMQATSHTCQSFSYDINPKF